MKNSMEWGKVSPRFRRGGSPIFIIDFSYKEDASTKERLPFTFQSDYLLLIHLSFKPR